MLNTERNTSLKELPLDTFSHKPDLYRFCILENYKKIGGNGLLSNWSLTTKYFYGKWYCNLISHIEICSNGNKGLNEESSKYFHRKLYSQIVIAYF